MKSVEEGTTLKLDFDKLQRVATHCPGVIPVAVQNHDTGEVILIAYTNEEAFRATMQTRRLILWSTSRNELWEKGRTSGQTFHLVEAYVNCEQNSLVYKVRPDRERGGICHTRNRQGNARHCFYRRIRPDTLTLENVDP